MKKLGYWLVIMITIVSLAACNQHQKEKDSVTEQKNVTDTKKEVKKENNKKSSSGEYAANKNKPVNVPKVPKVMVYQNKVFKEVALTESENEIIVTGKAQVFEGVFRYALYDGDKVIIENSYQTKGAPAWGDFKITFRKELITTNNSKFQLFVYSAKDGSKVNTLNIPIPKP